MKQFGLSIFYTLLTGVEAPHFWGTKSNQPNIYRTKIEPISYLKDINQTHLKFQGPSQNILILKDQN